ncbi:ferritin-like domain-containing protein [Clostridium sp. BSD9I1]|uniref:ferritin-like domain-containing protein n=1 Tax=Clostridium sp. BSD9I1 TaxID=2003589 RepID=UPI001FA82E7A|nr:ferritin-like domain-containing protein [Clostridium sp. BSD9I1]
MYFYNCPFFPCDYRLAVEEEIIDQPDIFGDPDIMGQQESMLEQQGMSGQQGLPSQQQGMMGQQGLPSQQQGMMGQQGLPSQQQGMMGQQGLPSQQQGMMGQQGLPSQQQGMMGQQGLPSQQQGMMGQQGLPSQQQVTQSQQQQDITSAELGEYTYPGNLNAALRLIQDSVSGEREDALFYNYLISVAPTQESRNIITTIRNDERKHNRMFRRIYFELTGRRLPASTENEFERPTSYCAGIKRALLGELAAVQRYRRIVFALQNRIQLNMLGEIITDELRHASLYNLLYSDGRCFNSRNRL